MPKLIQITCRFDVDIGARTVSQPSGMKVVCAHRKDVLAASSHGAVHGQSSTGGQQCQWLWDSTKALTESERVMIMIKTIGRDEVVPLNCA